MFFRRKKSSECTYVRIVENKRVDDVLRQSVIANLGRAEELAVSGASLLASGAKLTDQCFSSMLLINALDEDALDSGAKCNGSMRSGFGRLCQAL